MSLWFTNLPRKVVTFSQEFLATVVMEVYNNARYSSIGAHQERREVLRPLYEHVLFKVLVLYGFRMFWWDISKKLLALYCKRVFMLYNTPEK